MGLIRVLPDSLVNQIAAGEVIERPASIVKELVENSIDAGATFVTVEIQRGGIEKIIVTDDGIGMDEHDARLAFERHATSKIQTLHDLSNLRSLGFRGEALSSIASVSKVVLQTKARSALSGIRLEMDGGKLPIVMAAGCPEGTKFEISNLFFNTPARKKYLKSEATEYRHILDTVQDLSLAHPHVGFRFVSNGRTLFDLLKTEDVLTRIAQLLGKSLSQDMIPVFYGGRELHLSGYIGKPHATRTTRKYQYLIINGRPVTDNRLAYSVKEAYSNTIPSSHSPVFVVVLTIDPQQIDVNVHPRKLEVRFVNPHEVFRVVKSCVSTALSGLSLSQLSRSLPLRGRELDRPAFLRKSEIAQAGVTPQRTVEESGAHYDPTLPASPPSFSWGVSNLSTPSSPVSPSDEYSGNSPIGSVGSNHWDARKAYLLQKRAERLAQSSNTLASPVFQNPGSSPMPSPSDFFADEDRAHGNLRVLAQARHSYLVAEDDQGIAIIDQHAAHERVLLAQFRSNEAERSPVKQPLLTPLQLDLDYREKALLEEHLELLHSLGFEVSAFGGNTYIIEAVPDFLAHQDVDAVIRGFLDDLLNEHLPQEIARRHDEVLHLLACRAAAKFGRRLTSPEQEALIRSLQETPDGGSCAHGRPTMIRLTFDELERKFGRK